MNSYGKNCNVWKDDVKIPLCIKIRPALERLKGQGHNSRNCSRRPTTRHFKMFIRIAPEFNVSKDEVKIPMCIKTGPGFQCLEE